MRNARAIHDHQNGYHVHRCGCWCHRCHRRARCNGLVQRRRHHQQRRRPLLPSLPLPLPQPPLPSSCILAVPPLRCPTLRRAAGHVGVGVGVEGGVGVGVEGGGGHTKIALPGAVDWMKRSKWLRAT